MKEYQCNTVVSKESEAAEVNEIITENEQPEISEDITEPLVNGATEQPTPQTETSKTATLEESSEVLSPTLLWDDVEEEKENEEKGDEEEEELPQSAVHTASFVCTMTEEGWIKVHSNTGQPATIHEEETDDGFIKVNFVALKQREVEEGDYIELYSSSK